MSAAGVPGMLGAMGTLGVPEILEVGGLPVARAAFAVWGGTAELLVTDPAAIGDAERRLASELGAVGNACSRFQPDSELSAVNSASGGTVAVSPLFLEFLDAALRAATATSGAVDPTCGAALIALGYDRDFAELRRARPASGSHRAGAEGSDEAAEAAGPELGGPSAGHPDLGSVAPAAVGGSGRHRAPIAESVVPGVFGVSGAVERSGANGGRPVPVPGWPVIEVDWTRRTVRVPAGVALDLGATAKAHAADRAAWLLAQEFGCGVLVNLSGDLSMSGPAPAEGWPVRVADGEATGLSDPGQTVTLYDGGAATSGTSVRAWRHGARTVHHIVDPATGDSAAPYWQTVTAAAGSCLDANTLTTAALVRGPAILPFLRQAGCPMRLLGVDGRVTLLGGWPEEDS